MDKYAAKLLRGTDAKPFQIDDIYIRPLTLGQIEDMGMDYYYRLLNICMLEKEKFFEGVSKEDLQDLSIFDVLTLQNDMRNLFVEFLYTFVCNDGEGSIEYMKETHTVRVVYEGKIGEVNRSNLQEIFDLIKKMYCVGESKKESDRDDIDDEMRDLLREFEEEERKVSSANGANINLISIIDGVSSKHPSINLFNVWDLTVYQLMRKYYRINNIDNENRTMNGAYSGTIDIKGIKLEKLHWANEIG